MAPPSKLTPDTQDRICQLLRAGNTHEVAAEAAGISLSSFYNWKRDKPKFAEAIERAEAEAEAVLVARVSQAARNGSWRAATWLLERRNPEQWAPVRERTGHERASSGAVSLYEVSNPGRIRTKRA